MKKLVLKFRVRGKEEFEEKISAREVDFGPVFWEHDRVYLPRGYRRGGNFPRLVFRTEMKAVDRPARYFMILKRHIEDSGVEIEHTTLIRDYTEAVGVAMELGFELKAEVSRKRQEAKTKDGVKIFLDKVEGERGMYAKFEKVLTEGEKIEKARAEILDGFDMDEKDLVEKSYAEILTEGR